MSNKANQESICTNGTSNTFQSLQGTENRVGTQMHADTSVEQKAHDLCTLEANSPSCTHPAEQQAAPKAAPGEPSDTLFSQFLSDVMTAAGLVSHGKQCKALGDRLADMVMCLRAAPQQEAQEPALFVSAKQLADLVDPSHATGGSYLPARKTRAGLFTRPLYTAPQPAPAPQGVSDAMRVPLDSLHADAAYLIGRLREGSMPYARVIEIIRERIDAALAAQGGSK